MSVHEELVALLQADCDTPQACELANGLIRELRDRPPGTYTYESPSYKIRIRKD